MGNHPLYILCLFCCSHFLGQNPTQSYLLEVLLSFKPICTLFDREITFSFIRTCYCSLLMLFSGQSKAILFTITFLSSLLANAPLYCDWCVCVFGNILWMEGEARSIIWNKNEKAGGDEPKIGEIRYFDRNIFRSFLYFCAHSHDSCFEGTSQSPSGLLHQNEFGFCNCRFHPIALLFFKGGSCSMDEMLEVLDRFSRTCDVRNNFSCTAFVSNGWYWDGNLVFIKCQA